MHGPRLPKSAQRCGLDFLLQCSNISLLHFVLNPAPVVLHTEISLAAALSGCRQRTSSAVDPMSYSKELACVVPVVARLLSRR